MDSPRHFLGRLLVLLTCGLLYLMPRCEAVEVPEPAFVQVGEEQGLSNANVRTIAQDQQGFIWFGTAQGGLNRFDGYEMVSYGHDESQSGSIASNFIWSLLVDRSGQLWVGTDSGLDRFDPHTETFVHYDPKPGVPGALPNAAVLSLFEDAGGTLWVGSRGGLSRLDPATGVFETFSREAMVAGSRNTNSIRFITEDPATGLLWLGSSDGLAAFDPRTHAFASFVHDAADPESLCANSVNAVLIDDKGLFWVLTDGGLDAFAPSFDRVPGKEWYPPRQAFRHFRSEEADPETLAGSFLRGGTIDHAGRLWVASDLGLNLVDRMSGRVQRYRHIPGVASSLADDFCYAVFEDRSGNLWVSTVNAGVCRMRSDAKPFRVYQHQPGEPNSLSDNRVSSLSLDNQGRLWVGTARGLNCFDAGQWSHPRIGAGRATEDIAVVAAGPDGNLWVGTRNAGLWRYDGEEFHSYRSPRGNVPSLERELPYTGHEVNDLAFDRLGRLWLGVRAYGLDLYEHSRFRHFAPGASDKTRPTAFPALGALDETGCFWYGTESNGLVRLNPETDDFEVFLPNAERPEAWENRTIYFVRDDGAGGLWVGGATGLRRFDRASGRFVRRYTTSDGLPSNLVCSMELDLRGRLWLGTSGGLVRMEPETGRVRVYDIADGLPSNGFAYRASARDRSGRLYFGTKNGVVSFQPDALRDNPIAPQVVFTDFRVLDRPVVPGSPGSPLREAMAMAREVRISPKQAIFSIGFSALDFTAPEKNSYRYQMEGFDPEWRVASSDMRRANYTNLPPGEYVFRVKAANCDRVWNETGASLRVVVLPHWWSEGWFRGMVATAGFVLLVGGVYWRERAVRRRNEWLRQEVDRSTERLRAEVVVRERAEASLRDSHAQLENRVQERTAELAQANANLREEIVGRQKAEAQLRQAQKMEAFGQLAGGVAHDFNNLLTVILGQCEVLRDPELEETQRSEALHDVTAAARSASNLTRQLLVFSRQQAMNPVALDFNAVVAGVAKMLRRIIGENFELVTVLANEPLPVNADVAMLEQVLVNMAVNARDAMPRGGRLTISTQRRTLTAVEVAGQPGAVAGSYVLCSVADTGGGIAPEDLPRIFEPFFTTKAVGHGTGLGLATSLGIVQQHGGWIDLPTTSGAGTVFRIHLPCLASAPEAARPAARVTYAKGTATILLVEDQESVRKVAARMLSLQGYRVLEAADAAEALRVWADHRTEIAMLITDVVMPGEHNGRDLAAMLRADSKDLRIIVVTGYDPVQTGGLDGPGQPWDTHLRKPFTRDQLLSMVERLLAG